MRWDQYLLFQPALQSLCFSYLFIILLSSVWRLLALQAMTKISLKVPLLVIRILLRIAWTIFKGYFMALYWAQFSPSLCIFRASTFALTRRTGSITFWLVSILWLICSLTFRVYIVFTMTLCCGTWNTAWRDGELNIQINCEIFSWFRKQHSWQNILFFTWSLVCMQLYWYYFATSVFACLSLGSDIAMWNFNV